MALCVNDSGTWREISTLCVNDSGTWREISTGCINQSGTWREFGMAPNIAAAALGDNIEGGYLICKSSGVAWIVAPSSTEVSRTWTSRGDAITTAQANEACGDWFVPDCGQLFNPGSVCRTYWDSYVAITYWSNTNRAGSAPAGNAWTVSIPYEFKWYSIHTFSTCVRAFRCVTY